MGYKEKVYNNARKPVGFLGRNVLKKMNSGVHAVLADWGMDFLKKDSAENILDIGCGGGRNISVFLDRFTDAKVFGFDYSDVSVNTALKFNKKAVREGRCEVIKGDVAALPFDDGTFDLVSAFETVYFWPGPEESFRQVYRVLKDGGIFMIVNESDGDDFESERWEKIIEGLNRYDKFQLEGYLRDVGFGSVEVHHDEERHWLALFAVKNAKGK